jgi:hypothetical protein
MNTPQIGDCITYHGFDNVVSGIIAERAISPLTGNPRYRVVDSHQETKDPEAGKWINVEAVLGIHPTRCDHCNKKLNKDNCTAIVQTCDDCLANQAADNLYSYHYNEY